MRQAYPSGIRIAAVPRRVGLTIVGAALCLLAVGAGSALPQVPAGDFFEAIDHPAIGYHSVAPSDRVAQLARRIAAGEQTLTRDDQTGYLPALLRALDIPVASQLAVFSPTSLQKEIISPQNPRVIYFNESTVVAWPRGGFIEIAAQDPRQGVIFYAMPQQLLPRPSLIRRDDCLRCHYSYATGGVPGLLARSVVTGPRGESMPFLGNYLTDDRSPLEERWAGWFVTGSTGQGRHLGNQQPPATRNLDLTVAPQPSAVASFPEALKGHLSQQSDVVAHLVFDHQIRVTNLLTRSGWEVRLAEAEQHDVRATAERAARELVDALVFVDEARLPDGLGHDSDFAVTFASRGPADSRGRSLRTLDLRARLMRYACSFMIYSEAFDALPAAARDAAYRRLWMVLSGDVKDPRYSRLTAADRAATVEILKETKTGLPDYFKQPLSR